MIWIEEDFDNKNCIPIGTSTNIVEPTKDNACMDVKVLYQADDEALASGQSESINNSCRILKYCEAPPRNTSREKKKENSKKLPRLQFGDFRW